MAAAFISVRARSWETETCPYFVYESRSKCHSSNSTVLSRARFAFILAVVKHRVMVVQLYSCVRVFTVTISYVVGVYIRADLYEHCRIWTIMFYFGLYTYIRAFWRRLRPITASTAEWHCSQALVIRTAHCSRSC